jgi:hypothetical protein
MGQIRVSKRFATVLALAAIIVLSRIFPHPPNFTATIACILFGAAYLQTRWGWIVLLSAYWLGDLAINNLIYPSGMGFTWFTPGVIQLLVAYLLVFANAHWLLAKGAPTSSDTKRRIQQLRGILSRKQPRSLGWRVDVSSNSRRPSFLLCCGLTLLWQ